jgi:hypothetical protein
LARTNPLEQYFVKNRRRLIHKWIHYFDIYDRHFAPFRGKRITLVEVGVQHGGSLQMWRKYFGRRATVYGIDIDPNCARLAGRGIEIVIGDQEDREFLRSLRDRIGPIDILIDDGGHTMGQQLATFDELWPSIVDGGIYLIEDLHTSYWTDYGGGYLRKGTFIEFAKGLVDQVHAWHAEDGSGLTIDNYTRSVRGMHVYDSVIVFDKADVVPPHNEVTGTQRLLGEGEVRRSQMRVRLSKLRQRLPERFHYRPPTS